PVDALDHPLDVEQDDDAQDHQHELRDEVCEREHQVEDAGLLDSDDVHDDEERYESHGGDHVRGRVALERVQQADVLAQETQVADGEVGRYRNRRGVVEQLNPTHYVADGRVERATRKARASTRMRQ